MNDTPPAVDAMYRELLMKKSASERLCMAASMHDAAKAIVRAGIPADCRGTEVDLRIELFRRFYRQDFSSEEMTRIVEGLRNHPRNRQ